MQSYMPSSPPSTTVLPPSQPLRTGCLALGWFLQIAVCQPVESILLKGKEFGKSKPCSQTNGRYIKTAVNACESDVATELKTVTPSSRGKLILSERIGIGSETANPEH